MKKNIFTSESQLVASNGQGKISASTLKDKILSSVLLKNISELFSMIVEEKISPLQTLHLLHAMFALIFVVFPVEMSFVLRLLFIGWFALTLLQCKQSGLGEE